MSKESDRPTLGEYIRSARNEAGLSIRQLASLAGMNHSYLVKIETDQNDSPSADVLQRIAEVLEIDASELLAFVGVKPSSILPPATVYFRKKFGMSEAEAIEATRLIEQFTNKNRGGDDEQH